MSNPFTFGNPIRASRRFFGRTREVEQVFSRLRNEEFESSSVVGERRIGKTSLLFYLADADVRRSHELGDDRYNFVYVDFQDVSIEMGPEELWRKLVKDMLAQCAGRGLVKILTDLERSERLDSFALDEFFQQVDDMGQHVVFLFDEFERVTANENFGPDFYYKLRSLTIRHQVAMVTFSRRALIELCHSEDVKASPFFNIFANINLRLFIEDDRERMISRSLNGTGIEFTSEEMEKINELAGLHPFFLQVACHFLYLSYQEEHGEQEREDFLLENFRSQADGHFSDYWRHSSEYEKIVLTAAMLTEQKSYPSRDFSIDDLRHVFTGSRPCIEHLEKRGLLMRRGKGYCLFSSELGPWILDQITAGSGEEQSYYEWLTENRAAVDQLAGIPDSPLRAILPKIGSRYRDLIMTWARDPGTVAAMIGLLNSALFRNN